jgi:hypothetical protein
MLKACFLDMKEKERIWRILVDKKGHANYYEYEMLMKGFARPHQYQHLKKYFEEKFFYDFLEVKANQKEEYAVMFFNYLSPKFVNNEEILREFYKLERYVYPTEYQIQNILKNSNMLLI